VIDDVIGFVRHHSNLENIQIETVFEPDVPPVLMDEKKIKQVLINLLMNAIHAVARNGTIKITTGLNGANRRITVEVSDTGHGIDKENLLRIFDPFFTTKPTGEGTGLGTVGQLWHHQRSWRQHHGKKQARPRRCIYTVAARYATPFREINHGTASAYH
jgi:signal transduction histidine kinase